MCLHVAVLSPPSPAFYSLHTFMHAFQKFTSKKKNSAKVRVAILVDEEVYGNSIQLNILKRDVRVLRAKRVSERACENNIKHEEDQVY